MSGTLEDDDVRQFLEYVVSNYRIDPALLGRVRRGACRRRRRRTTAIAVCGVVLAGSGLLAGVQASYGGHRAAPASGQTPRPTTTPTPSPADVRTPVKLSGYRLPTDGALLPIGSRPAPLVLTGSTVMTGGRADLSDQRGVPVVIVGFDPRCTSFLGPLPGLLADVTAAGDKPLLVSSDPNIVPRGVDQSAFPIVDNSDRHIAFARTPTVLVLDKDGRPAVSWSGGISVALGSLPGILNQLNAETPAPSLAPSDAAEPSSGASPGPERLAQERAITPRWLPAGSRLRWQKFMPGASWFVSAFSLPGAANADTEPIGGPTSQNATLVHGGDGLILVVAPEPQPERQLFDGERSKAVQVGSVVGRLVYPTNGIGTWWLTWSDRGFTFTLEDERARTIDGTSGVDLATLQRIAESVR
jgi:hypothetical protein